MVASELVVTVIVGAFAKVGKSLENFYDMLAALDKVGHVLDLHTEPHAIATECSSRAGRHPLE